MPKAYWVQKTIAPGFSLELPDASFDALLSDPPYHLTQKSRNGSPQPGTGNTPYSRHGVGTDRGFMGHTWDGGDVAFRVDVWKEFYRVLKPGAFGLVFGGTRTFHRMAVSIEDAGFEIVDTLMWLYGTGFPKSLNISKSLDRYLGRQRKVIGKCKHPTLRETARLDKKANAAHGDNAWAREWDITAPASTEAEQWQGFGTALKPAYEPILLFRKPFEKEAKTYAENVLRHHCGALNIDACRIPLQEDGEDPRLGGKGVWRTDKMARQVYEGGYAGEVVGSSPEGRFPANVILDEVAAQILDEQAGIRRSGAMHKGTLRRVPHRNVYGKMPDCATQKEITGSVGGASRFFYVTKVSSKERHAGVASPRETFSHGSTLRKVQNQVEESNCRNHHPTLKPIELTKYLATLLLPPENGSEERKLFVPFSGAGSEVIGAGLAGWDRVVAVEQSAEYLEIAKKRWRYWLGEAGAAQKEDTEMSPVESSEQVVCSGSRNLELDFSFS